MNLLLLLLLLILIATWTLSRREKFQSYADSCQRFCSDQRDRCLQASAPRWCDYSGEFCDRGCEWSRVNVFN